MEALENVGQFGRADAWTRILHDDRVLIVSNYTEQPYIHEAFKKGVAGYMDKVDCSAFLPEAVRTVVEGEKYLSPSLAWQSGPPGSSSMN